eukprot:360689-Chlamydomonas_euryale.AAC.3
MELHDFGPAKLFDTAGIDEEGALGNKKRAKTLSTLKVRRADWEGEIEGGGGCMPSPPPPSAIKAAAPLPSLPVLPFTTTTTTTLIAAFPPPTPLSLPTYPPHLGRRD